MQAVLAAPVRVAQAAQALELGFAAGLPTPAVGTAMLPRSVNLTVAGGVNIELSTLQVVQLKLVFWAGLKVWDAC